MRWFIVLFLIVCTMSLAFPPDPQALKDFNISATQFRLIITFLLIPEAILWFAGFYVFAKIHEYTKYLAGSREYNAFHNIRNGMGILAFGLIIPSIISLPLNYIASQNSGFKPTSVIINHYISLLVAILAFSYLRSGSQKLVGSGKNIKRGSLNGMRLFELFFIFLAVAFTYATFYTKHNGNNPYYLGIYPLMITIIVPYLYAWFEGLVSAYNFRLYSKNVKGYLYKKAFFQLSIGLGITVLGFISVQFITSTLGAGNDKSLGFILGLIYILLAILLAGLSIMALGTKKLKLIEEV